MRKLHFFTLFSLVLFLGNIGFSFAEGTTLDTSCKKKIEDEHIVDNKIYFSPDGLHTAYLKNYGDSMVVLDGVEGKHYSNVYNVRFLPDNRLSYIGEKLISNGNTESFLVIDGVEGKHYLGSDFRKTITSLNFSSDGKHSIYYVPKKKDFGKGTLVKDGKETVINRGYVNGIAVDPNFTKVTYWGYGKDNKGPDFLVENGKDVSFLENGKKVNLYDIKSFGYSYDGSSFAYKASKGYKGGPTIIIKDGKEVLPYSYNNNLYNDLTWEVKFSPVSNDFYYIGYGMTYSAILKNGVEIFSSQGNKDVSVYITKDGSFYYMMIDKDSHKSSLYKDKTLVSDSIPEVDMGSKYSYGDNNGMYDKYYFSNDLKNFVYQKIEIRKIKGKIQTIWDGEKEKEADVNFVRLIKNGVVISDDFYKIENVYVSNEGDVYYTAYKTRKYLNTDYYTDKGFYKNNVLLKEGVTGLPGVNGDIIYFENKPNRYEGQKMVMFACGVGTKKVETPSHLSDNQMKSVQKLSDKINVMSDDKKTEIKNKLNDLFKRLNESDKRYYIVKYLIELVK